MNKILIIEDESTLREEIADILRFEGFEVLQCDNGKDGLETAIDQIPDLILCDIMMPRMKGTEVLKSLMQYESTRHIPFIFITALSERMDIRSGMESGADDYLVKPFSVNELLGSIRSRIGKAESRQRLIKNTVMVVQNDLSKQMMQLKDKIVDQTNDIDLLRLEQQILKNQATEQETLGDTLQVIESDNRFHNMEKIVDRELRIKQPTKTMEQVLIKLQNEIIKQSYVTNTWSIFQLRFNELHPNYFEKLTGRFPNLKQAEIALASAIEMNLSTLQISSLLNITAASTRKNKYRLKKKMSLHKDDSLAAFLHSL